MAGVKADILLYHDGMSS